MLLLSSSLVRPPPSSPPLYPLPQSEDASRRLKAVSLIGSLLASPYGRNVQHCRPLYSEFLRRVNDKSVDVRLRMVSLLELYLAPPASEPAPPAASPAAAGVASPAAAAAAAAAGGGGPSPPARGIEVSEVRSECHWLLLLNSIVEYHACPVSSENEAYQALNAGSMWCTVSL